MAYVPRYKRGPVQQFVPYNGKIADITHADINKHTLELANAAGTGAIAGETRKIIGLILRSERIAGTDRLRVYPNEGATYIATAANDAPYGTIIIANGTQRLDYRCGAVNDDYDVYCYGYIVEV